MSQMTLVSRVQSVGAPVSVMSTKNPQLLKNEIGLVEIPNSDSSKSSSYKMVIGDGVHNFLDLPYLNTLQGIGDTTLTIDDGVAQFNTSSNSLGSVRITNINTPIENSDAANKSYVDNYFDSASTTLSEIINEIAYVDATDTSVLGPFNLDGYTSYTTSLISTDCLQYPKNYQIIFDGVSYSCMSNQYSDGVIAVGNYYLKDSSSESNNIPVLWYGDTIYTADQKVHTLQIFRHNETA